MLTDFFEPRMSPKESRSHRIVKFSMFTHLPVLRGFTEGFFEFWPRARDMGHPLGGQGGPKNVEIFFSKFDFFWWNRALPCLLYPIWPLITLNYHFIYLFPFFKVRVSIFRNQAQIFAVSILKKIRVVDPQLGANFVTINDEMTPMNETYVKERERRP